MSLSLDPLLGKDEQLLELYKAREDAQHALEHENFSVAESKFKLAMELESALGIEATQGEARTGLIETRYRAGLHAEEVLRHLREARNYYRDVLNLDPDHSQARAHLDAVTRKITVRRAIIGTVSFIILAIAAVLLNQRIPKPAEICAISGDILCTPTPTFTLTPTATSTPTPTPTATPTPTPTPTPYLVINVINPQATPVTVREIGRLEDQQNTSVCEDCRQANTAFADAATQVGAYIELYEEQVILDEDSLPAPNGYSKPIPDHDKVTSPHYVQWPRWDTGEHNASFVVATVTPTPTPMPITVKGSAPNPNVFDKPGGTLQFYLQRGVCVYVCDEVDEFYQVANDHCHLTTPIGWVPKKHLSEPINGACPAPTATPTPTPTGG